MKALKDKAPDRLKQSLINRARDEGFSLCQVTEPRLPFTVGRNLIAFLRSGQAGTMDWLYKKAGRRRSPHALWPQAQSAIMLAMPYHDGTPLEAGRGSGTQGIISVYAQGQDYHKVIKKRLKRLAGWLALESGDDVKVFVDTAPLMEKPLAAQAGLGWQGKHTNLVSRDLGSWFFLGVILSATALPRDESESNHCGQCERCLIACPTKAITAPFRLNASACLSYLTIEHQGAIPANYRKAMGNRIFGCDDCLAVCPWNKFAVAASTMPLMPDPTRQDPLLAELLSLGEEGFCQRFAGSPVRRLGWLRFWRNCLIAAGNSGDESLLPPITQALTHSDPVIKEAADWAKTRLHELRESI